MLCTNSQRWSEWAISALRRAYLSKDIYSLESLYAQGSPGFFLIQRVRVRVLFLTTLPCLFRCALAAKQTCAPSALISQLQEERKRKDEAVRLLER
jgi:hypothetical protein